MKDVLELISDEMERLNIPYTFNGWDSEQEIPKFIGDITEVKNPYEDGKNEYSFNLTGFGQTYDQLYSYAEALKKEYKNSKLVNGMVITYENTDNIPNNSEDLKQIQINFNIKNWRLLNYESRK